jgi:putative flippase GtrA
VFQAETVQRFVRFFTTAVGGLIVDLAIAWTVVTFVGLPDTHAATVGLLAGMVVGYLGHLTWTFRGSGHTVSLGHFIKFATGTGVTLLVRLATLSAIGIAGLQEFIPTIVRLGLAAGLSFALSYIICRTIIFRPKAN